MLEVLVLSRENIYEVAKKTGRAVDELETMLGMAERRNEYVVFTVETIRWLIEKTQEKK